MKSAVLAIALLVRLLLLDFASIDYRVFLSRWYDFFVEHGAWRGLGLHVPDCVYSPLYLYFVSVSTLLPVPKLYAIKSWSIAADFVVARYGCRLVEAGNRRCRAFHIACFLLLPTMVVNSALWGQCDSMYTASLLASLYCFAERRPSAGLAAFGLAWAFKPQAVFWCPLLAGLLLAGRLPWRVLWVAPAVYVASTLPALLAGQSLGSILWPVSQASLASGLTFSAPNWYQWVDPGSVEGSRSLFVLGLIFAGLSAAAIGLLVRRGPPPGLPQGAWLTGMALLSCIAMPFLLPGMHERYFFPADVLAVVYAMQVRMGWHVAALMQCASLGSYSPFLTGTEPIPLSWLAVLPVVALIEVVATVLMGSARELARTPGQDVAGSPCRPGSSKAASVP